MQPPGLSLQPSSASEGEAGRVRGKARPGSRLPATCASQEPVLSGRDQRPPLAPSLAPPRAQSLILLPVLSLLFWVWPEVSTNV